VAVLEIRLYGDPVLTQRSDQVTRFDAELARFGDDLLGTLQAAHGVGLAAPQVGVLKRMFAYDIPPDEETGEHPHGVLVNPVITHWEGEQDGEEGCLSFPGIYYACKRAMLVTASAVDVHGRPLELTGEGLLARCIQHEIDHLDGVLFIDRLSRGDRKRALRQWRERDLDLELQGGIEPHLHRSDLTGGPGASSLGPRRIPPDKTL
jgi:peptide deformylase